MSSGTRSDNEQPAKSLPATVPPGSGEQQIPLAGPGDPQEGKRLFVKHTCESCHPGGGNAMQPNKPLKGAEFGKRYPRDEMITQVVRNGIPRTVMQGFSSSVLPDRDLSDIIAYIRSLTPEAVSGENAM